MSESITIQQKGLKEKIKNKFVTRSRFAKIANLDYYNLQRTLNEKNVDVEKLNQISMLVDIHEDKSLLGEISDAARHELRRRIKREGGLKKFCQDNPQFNKSTVYQVVSGVVKKLDNTAEKLLKHFNI